MSPEQAKEIYALKDAGYSQREVGEMYGISGSNVWHIWNEVTWWRDNQGMENFPEKLGEERR